MLPRPCVPERADCEDAGPERRAHLSSDCIPGVPALCGLVQDFKDMPGDAPKAVECLNELIVNALGHAMTASSTWSACTMSPSSASVPSPRVRTRVHPSTFMPFPSARHLLWVHPSFCPSSAYVPRGEDPGCTLAFDCHPALCHLPRCKHLKGCPSPHAALPTLCGSRQAWLVLA